MKSPSPKRVPFMRSFVDINQGRVFQLILANTKSEADNVFSSVLMYLFMHSRSTSFCPTCSCSLLGVDQDILPRARNIVRKQLTPNPPPFRRWRIHWHHACGTIGCRHFLDIPHPYAIRRSGITTALAGSWPGPDSRLGNHQQFTAPFTSTPQQYNATWSFAV